MVFLSREDVSPRTDGLFLYVSLIHLKKKESLEHKSPLRRLSLDRPALRRQSSGNLSYEVNGILLSLAISGADILATFINCNAK